MLPSLVGRSKGLLRATARVLILSGLSFAPSAGMPQELRPEDRGRARIMLKTIKGEIAKEYYDPAFHGLDLEARFRAADETLGKAAGLGQAFGIIAQAVLDLNDSHTFFIPPERTLDVDYGWRMGMVGDACYVLAVKPGSDAAGKGMRPGDRVLSVQGYEPRRENLWRLRYLIEVLRPQPALKVEVQGPGSAPRALEAAAAVEKRRAVVDLTNDTEMWGEIRTALKRAPSHRYQEYDDLVIWSMPDFDLERAEVDKLIDSARKRKALLVDLRGNPGGTEEVLLRLLGGVFDRPLSVAEIKGRKGAKPLVAKSRGEKAFTGPLAVLVDSESASAAEIFARVLQLEKRGTVIGDRTKGAVMRSRLHPFQIGVERVVPYAIVLTEADLVMSDSKSLERAGVTPDEVVLPSPEDLQAGRDPVLARAATRLGHRMDAETAGKLFPLEWPE